MAKVCIRLLNTSESQCDELLSIRRMTTLLMCEKTALYQFFIQLLPPFPAKLAMQSRESKLGLLLEDAQTALEQGVKSGAVRMDMQLEIRYRTFLCDVKLRLLLF